MSVVSGKQDVFCFPWSETRSHTGEERNSLCHGGVPTLLVAKKCFHSKRVSELPPQMRFSGLHSSLTSLKGFFSPR